MTPVRLLAKWFPRAGDRQSLKRRMADFYAANLEYHGMTAAGDKAAHPQVGLLQCIVEENGKYAEVGCGGGSVCATIWTGGRMLGMDRSAIALRKAKERCHGSTVDLVCADAGSLPVADNAMDGCYAFELLEHVFDPLQVISEMVRITKSGGFILLSAPNAFSLDMHLSKRAYVRLCEIVLAAARLVCDTALGSAYVAVKPDIDGDVYPDCDMITSLVPHVLSRSIDKLGCNVVFWDTTYMCAHRDGSNTDLRFQRLTNHRFFRNFGDHLLLLARKR